MSPKRIVSLLTLAAVALPGLSRGDTSPSQAIQPFIDRIERLRTQVRSVDAVEDSLVRDERPGKPPAELRRRARLLYRADLGRLSRESESEGTTPASPRSIRVAVAGGPPVPSWILQLPETFRRSRCTVRRSGGHTLVSVVPFPSGKGRPAAEVEFDGDRLPVRLVTFGATGQLLDEATVRWRTVKNVPFPEEAAYRFHSVENLLTRTTSYRDIRINPVLSASLFGTP